MGKARTDLIKIAEEKEGEHMLTLTDSAVRKFKEFLVKEGIQGNGIRIFLVGGC